MYVLSFVDIACFCCFLLSCVLVVLSMYSTSNLRNNALFGCLAYLRNCVCTALPMSTAINLEHPDARNNESFSFGGEVALSANRHPIASTFHVGFRAASLVWYILSEQFLGSKQFVLSFIVQVLLLALDFWTVKNVTGRLLVGLRWWNEIKEDGTSEWIFEQKEVRKALYLIVEVANACVVRTIVFGAGWLLSKRINLRICLAKRDYSGWRCS